MSKQKKEVTPRIVQFDPDVLMQIKAYQKVYQEAYGKVINLGDAVGRMVAAAFGNHLFVSEVEDLKAVIRDREQLKAKVRKAEFKELGI